MKHIPTPGAYRELFKAGLIELLKGITCRIGIAESDGLKTKQPSAVFQTLAGSLTPARGDGSAFFIGA